MLMWRVDLEQVRKQTHRPITMPQKYVLLRHTKMPLSKINTMSIDDARREISLLVDSWWYGRRLLHMYFPDLDMHWGDVDEADEWGAGPEF